MYMCACVCAYVCSIIINTQSYILEEPVDPHGNIHT